MLHIRRIALQLVIFLEIFQRKTIDLVRKKLICIRTVSKHGDTNLNTVRTFFARTLAI